MLSWAKDAPDLLMIMVGVVVSPIMLFSSWAVLNVPFLIFYIFSFLRGEGDSYRVYGLVLAVEAMVCLLGDGKQFLPTGLEFVACLVLWLCLIGLVEFAIWKLRCHNIEKLERDIELVREKNARARGEKLAADRERMCLEKPF
jgi:hypothetical protein